MMVVSVRVLVFVVLTVRGLDCEPAPARIYCTLIDKRLLCNVTLLAPIELSEEFVFLWHQKYNGLSIIRRTPVVPAVKVKQLKFEMRIQNFDNQTYIYGQFFNSKTQKYFLTEEYQVSVTNKKKYDVKNKILYSEIEPVTFTCISDAHTQVGWIESTGNKIVTFNQSNHSQMFYKRQNGSMLCCLHYGVSDLTVTRYIDETTVLIYEEPSNQGATTTSTSTAQSSTTQPKASTSTTRPGANSVMSPRLNGDESKKTPYIHQPSASTKEPQIKNVPKSSDDLEHTQNTDQHNGSSSASEKKKYYVIIASVAGTILVASLIYFVMVKKCTRKASDPQDPQNELQLETYASTNVVYAELDMKPGNTSVPATTDSPYAEIIGVLRPITEDVKK